MKVLLVNNDKGWGGGQEHLKELSARIAKMGCRPSFLCRSGSPSEEVFRSLGYPVYSFERSMTGILRMLVSMAMVIRRESFDILLVAREHDLPALVLAWKLASPFKKLGKLVVCFHTATSRRLPFLCFADAVVCVSSYVQKALRAGNHLAAQRMSILHNGIDSTDELAPEKFSPRRKRRFFQGEGFPLIGMVGAFFKNQLELLEVIPLVKRKFPALKLALVGDDSDSGLTGPIREKICFLNIADDVIFTGKVPHEKLSDIYFDLDLSVSTFRNEGFGLVHLESLSAGTPVVCYDEGGQLDIFGGTSTAVVVTGGPEEFAAAIIGLLENDQKRMDMGREGRNLVERRFSLERMGSDYVTLFRRMHGDS